MVRLVEGNNTDSGHVEIAHNGYWGIICGSEWDDREAHVFCRMLGYQSGNGYSGKVNWNIPIVINEIYCNGSEKLLNECEHQISTSSCQWDEYAYASCHMDGFDTLVKGKS